jgi:hypothetical protein
MLTLDGLRLAKGYILNKMYFHGYVCRRTGHGKHTSVDDLSKGCPAELAQYMKNAIDELKVKNRLLVTWPAGYGERCCAVANQAGYDFANAYNAFASLPLIQYGKPQPYAKTPPMPMEELRKLKIRKRSHKLT